MAKIKICFIVNPISGGKKKDGITALINQHLDLATFEVVVHETTHTGHASLLAAAAVEQDFEIIAAVGGDGTINEIARVVCNTDKAMAIIPFGSGNGLARFLGIPLKAMGAIELINKRKTIAIDTATLNGHPFFNIAGIGFDAEVGHAFAMNEKRGLSTYIKTTIKKFTQYKPVEYLINIDGVVIKQKALAISIANSSQYGNNIHIAPKASITDGLLDVCFIKPLTYIGLPRFFYHALFSKEEDETLILVIKGKQISIEVKEPTFVHLDGEPFELYENIEISVNPLSLNVIVK